MSRITVKQFWVRFPVSWSSGMTPREAKKKLDSFYAGMGTNLPQYCEYDGGHGTEASFCVSKYFDSRLYSADAGADSYVETLFITDTDKFNSDHVVCSASMCHHGDHGDQPYVLVKKDD